MKVIKIIADQEQDDERSENDWSDLLEDLGLMNVGVLIEDEEAALASRVRDERLADEKALADAECDTLADVQARYR